MARCKEYFIELSKGTEISSCTEVGQFEIYEEEETDITETVMTMVILKTKLGKAGHDVISPGMIKYMSKAGKMIFLILQNWPGNIRKCLRIGEHLQLCPFLRKKQLSMP